VDRGTNPAVIVDDQDRVAPTHSAQTLLKPPDPFKAQALGKFPDLHFGTAPVVRKDVNGHECSRVRTPSGRSRVFRRSKRAVCVSGGDDAEGLKRVGEEACGWGQPDKEE